MRPRCCGVFRVEVREARTVHIVRRTLMGASAVGLATLLSAATMTSFAAPPAGAATVPPQIPQVAAAQVGGNVDRRPAERRRQYRARRLAGKPVDDCQRNPGPGRRARRQCGRGGCSELSGGQRDAYINSSSTSNEDGPGQLANLILDAHALGADPTNFGGTNLVTRLLATEQTSGPDAGLFGTETQLNGFATGGYTQGLVFTALKAVGQTANASAISWLTAQQCPSGGWVFQSQATSFGGCTEDPSNGSGPDTNSTSLALQGLAAQGALTPTIESGALSYLTSGQDADGGWSLYQNSTAQPQQSDSQSTGLVIQAVLAAGFSPTNSTFTSSGHSPVSALLSFVVTSGSDAGAVWGPRTTPRATSSPPIRTFRSWPA